MEDGHEPDALEKGIRFGCGSVFGFVVAFFAIGQEVAEFTGPFWASVAGIALILGLLAVRYGDEFWHWALGLFHG